MIAEYKESMKWSLETEGWVSDEDYVLVIRQIAAVAGLEDNEVEAITTIEHALEVLYAICRVAKSNPAMLAAAMAQGGVPA